MEIYIIIAISFSLMYNWNYTREVLAVTNEVAEMFGEKPLNIPWQLLIHGILITILAPFFCWNMMVADRKHLIKEHSMGLLEKIYGLKAEE